MSERQKGKGKMRERGYGETESESERWREREWHMRSNERDYKIVKRFLSRSNRESCV
jgi:hypothetical protein